MKYADVMEDTTVLILRGRGDSKFKISLCDDSQEVPIHHCRKK
jgi:hypothetical protein